MLLARRAEKDFLLRSDEKYITANKQLTAKIGSNLDKLGHEVADAGHRELVSTVQAVGKGLETYVKHFGALADLRVKQGLNQDSGLEGTLRGSVHAIEAALKDVDEPRLMAAMLMLRRHEKDFMLRRDAAYIKALDGAVEDFRKALSATGLSAGMKDDIGKKLAAYQRDFHAWADGAVALASEQQAVSASFAAIDPQIETLGHGIDAIVADAEASNASSQSATNREIMIMIVSVTALVALLAFFVGRAIVKPLSAITTAMVKLASGNFDVVLPGLGRKDEIGEMAQAVETSRSRRSKRRSARPSRRKPRRVAARPAQSRYAQARRQLRGGGRQYHRHGVVRVDRARSCSDDFDQDGRGYTAALHDGCLRIRGGLQQRTVGRLRVGGDGGVDRRDQSAGAGVGHDRPRRR